MSDEVSLDSVLSGEETQVEVQEELTLEAENPEVEETQEEEVKEWYKKVYNYFAINEIKQLV